MAQVFISYSTKHRDLTRQLAAVIEGQGYTVWWDEAIESWGSLEAQIRAAKWKRPPKEWHAAKSQLAIQFGERFMLSA